MERTFATIIVGKGTTADRLAGAISTHEPSVAVAEPQELADVPLEKITSVFTGSREYSEPVPLPSLVRTSGEVVFEGPQRIRIGADVWKSKKIILAMGARPLIPAIQGLPDCHPLVPTDILESDPTGENYLIIGGGPMACSLAFWLRQKTKKVSLLARSPRLLTAEEPELAAAVAENMVDLGIQVEANAKPLQVHRDGSTTHVVFERDGIRQEIKADEVVVACGLKPNTDKLGLSKAGVFTNETGAVVVNEEMRTSAYGIWAAGTVTNEPVSLNQIENQIRLVASNIQAPFFSRERRDPDPLPYHFPFQPAFSRSGWSENEAKKRWSDIRTVVVPLEGGLAKIIGRKKTGLFLGASLFCEGAAELSLFFNLAFQMQMSLWDLNLPQHYLPLTASWTARRMIEAWIRS